MLCLQRRLNLSKANQGLNAMHPSEIGRDFFLEMRRAREVQRTTGGYASKDVSPDTRTVVAEFAVSAKRRGVPLEEFVKIAEGTSYTPAPRTLYRHVAAIERGDAPLSAKKATGARSLLTLVQKEILGGYLLTAEKKTDLFVCQTKSMEFFGVKIGHSTAGNYVHELELSFQLVGARSMPKDMTFDMYVKSYFDWLFERHQEGWLIISPSLLWCMDSFTDSHRRDREKTISGLNQKQRKLAGHKWVYTNNYLCCIWADGVNRTPTLCFTFNKKLDPDGPNRKNVLAWCKVWGIDPSRIYYLQSSKHYCKESSDQVSEFCCRYRDKFTGTHGYHDGGGAFKIKKTLITSDVAKSVRVMPSVPHGELSTCDNHYNALVKKSHSPRASVEGDEAENAIIYLAMCDRVDSGAIAHMFTRNLFLDHKNITLAEVEARLRGWKGLNIRRERLFAHYMDCYHDFLPNFIEEQSQKLNVAKDDEMDGAYWTQNTKKI